jgi:hypothetical protein
MLEDLKSAFSRAPRRLPADMAGCARSSSCSCRAASARFRLSSACGLFVPVPHPCPQAMR